MTHRPRRRGPENRPVRAGARPGADRPTTLGVLSPSTGGLFFGEVLAGVLAAVDEAGGGRVVLVQTLDAGQTADIVPPAEGTPPLAWSQVDALVAIAWAAEPAVLNRARAAGVPVVLASNALPGVDAASVVVDNVGGIRLAVEHLVAHGHTAIGFVGHVGQSDVAERHVAYEAAMRAAGLEPLPMVTARDQVESGGAAAAPEVLAASPRWTAAIAGTDRIAAGLVRAVTERGVDVPGDLAVVGFDDAEVGWSLDPPLTTVRQDCSSIGAVAARLAMAEAAGRPVPHTRTTVEATFVVRQSCGCLPSLPNLAPDYSGAAETLLRAVWGVIGLEPGDVPPHGSVADLGPAPQAYGLDDIDLVHLDEAVARAVSDLVAVPAAPERVEGFAQASVLRMAEIAARMPVGSPERVTMQYTVSRFVTLLGRVQARDGREHVRRLSAALGVQLDVGLRLLGRPLDGDPTDLAWLSAAGVSTACLGLWADDERTTLRIAGVRDEDGHDLGRLVGTVTTVEEFPPSAVLDVADAGDRTVAYVIPVRGAGDDHGALCLVAPLDRHYGTARATYDHWAALLGVALREQALLEGLRHSEQRHALAARAAAEGLWEWDTRTDAVYVSDRALELLDLDEAPHGFHNEAFHPDDRERAHAILMSSLETPGVPVEVEARVQRRDGTTRWVAVRALAVPGDDGDGAAMVGAISDIDERKSLEEMLRRAALYDHVTGLPNRRLFLDRLASALGRPHDGSTPRFAVLFLDLDGFKLVNDSLGHLAGDELLQVVGERLRADLRAVDTAARFGGDEFAVLLAGPVPEDLLVVARRIQRRIGAPVPLGDHDVTVTASIGIATSATSYADAEDVLRDADIAMYRAKEAGGGTACIFDPEMHERALSRMHTRTTVTRAIEERQFVVHYQPVVDLADPTVREFEALVRWSNPQRGLLPPSKFLPHLEGTQAIVTLGRQVLDTVCAQLAEWRRAHGDDVTVAVNLSHREFWSADLPAAVACALAAHDVPGSALVLETTESVISTAPDDARAVVAELRRAGVRVRLDDFGAGHSCVRVLRSFPLDALKIDGELVAELGSGTQAKALVAAIVALGRALEVEVDAEWVETPEQAALLAELGCRAAQGWLFARALPPDQAGALIGRRLGPSAGSPTTSPQTPADGAPDPGRVHIPDPGDR